MNGRKSAIQQDAKPSEDSDGHQHGSFFGRRKGHRLRARQADLIEQLLPRLAVDIGVPSPPDVAAMFDPRADAVRLEIGFGGGEHLIAEALACRIPGSSAASLMSTAWRKS